MLYSLTHTLESTDVFSYEQEEDTEFVLITLATLSSIMNLLVWVLPDTHL